MDRGLYVAMTGAKQIMQAQAMNNNNIANLNTVGFRADTVSFASEPIYGPGYATRVNAVAGDSGTDFTGGVLMTTGQPQGADGKEAYTRAGQLIVTESGVVTTANGFPVLSESGQVNIPPATSATIGADGTVSIVPLGLPASAQSQVDRIKLVNPPLSSLRKGADGLFRPQSGAKVPTDESVTVSSGVLESSNVNAAQSLVNMIQLQRLYEFQIKSINSTDQNEQNAERMMISQ